jgi:hypothetical protein
MFSMITYICLTLWAMPVAPHPPSEARLNYPPSFSKVTGPEDSRNRFGSVITLEGRWEAIVEIMGVSKGSLLTE